MIEKLYYKTQEVCDELKLTKEEILETISEYKIKVPQYVNGELKFTKELIRKIGKAYWGGTYYKEKRVKKKSKTKVKMTRRVKVKIISPLAYTWLTPPWYPTKRSVKRVANGKIYLKKYHKKNLVEVL